MDVPLRRITKTTWKERYGGGWLFRKGTMLANGYSTRLLDLRVVYFILWKEYLGSQAFIFAMWKL